MYQNIYNPYNSYNQGIVWVQGENGAKSYMTAPNQSVLLMDSEAPVFYIKTTDQAGMPSPLRVFDYKEREGKKNDYITREEFDKLIEKLGVKDNESDL